MRPNNQARRLYKDLQANTLNNLYGLIRRHPEPMIQLAETTMLADSGKKRSLALQDNASNKRRRFTSGGFWSGIANSCVIS